MPSLTNLSKEQRAEKGFVATFNRDTFMYCCGGREIGGLECHSRPRYVEDMWKKGRFHENRVYPTKKEAWKARLPEMRSSTTGYPLMLNVVEEYTPELATLLREQEDVKEVLTWYNPNTGNIITMFILTNGADETAKDNDDDNED